MFFLNFFFYFAQRHNFQNDILEMIFFGVKMFFGPEKFLECFLLLLLLTFSRGPKTEARMMSLNEQNKI